MLDVAAHVSHSIVPRVLDVIAQRRTPAILRALAASSLGFDALVRTLGISRSTLTIRLTHLIDEGCVEKREATYALTARGRGLVGVLCVMSGWDGAPSGLVHTCGHPLAVRVTCAGCDAIVRARDVGIPDAPSTPRVVSVPSRTRGIAITETLDAETLLADKWTTRIIALAFFGVRRFADMASLLAIATNVLTARLALLTTHGVLERRLYEERPPRSEYVLTPRGHALFPLVLAMIDWGDRTYRPETPTDMTHRPCGARLVVAVRCEACSERLADAR